jgi:uncharacterized membrane protein
MRDRQRTTLSVPVTSLAVIVALALGVTTPVAAASPSIVDLGTLPGDTESTTAGLNESGTVIGQSFSGNQHDPATRARAVRWSPGGAVTALPIPAGISHPHSRAVAINDSGAITGYTYDAPLSQVHRSLRWASDGTVTELKALPGDTSTLPRGISRDGTVAGDSYTPGGVYHAVKWAPDGTVTVLNPVAGDTDARTSLINDNNTVVGRSSKYNSPGHTVRWNPDDTIDDISAHVSIPYAINGDGVISGWGSNGHGYRLNPDGTVIDLGMYANTAAISADGTVVGGFWVSPHFKRAARWGPDGTATTLPHLPTDTNGFAKDINSAGTIVGVSSIFRTMSSEEGHAVKWTPDGTVTALGFLPGGTQSHASFINSTGTIAGTATTSTGKLRAVLWHP